MENVNQFSQLQWISLWTFIIGVFWQPYQAVNYSYFNQIESAFRQRGWWIPSKGVYGYVWFFIFAMIATSGFIFFNYESNTFGRTNVLVFLVFFTANNFFVKIWPLFFFRTKQIALALFTSLMILLTAIVLVVFAILEAVNVNVIIWISFALLIPYVIWAAIATFINYRWWKIHKERRVFVM